LELDSGTDLERASLPAAACAAFDSGTAMREDAGRGDGSGGKWSIRGRRELRRPGTKRRRSSCISAATIGGDAGEEWRQETAAAAGAVKP
jgi:hypothetical protein